MPWDVMHYCGAGSASEASTSTAEAASESGGILVDVYMLDQHQHAWVLPARELLAVCPANLSLTVQERGERLPSSQVECLP